MKPQYEYRMIKAGYGNNVSAKSTGKYMDIERAFHGYPGPLTKKYNKKFDPRKYVQDPSLIKNISDWRI